MENGSLSASDVALLSDRNGYGDMWGGNSMMWIFALLILAGGGFSGWGNNGFANAIGYENLATQSQVDRGFDTQNMMANQRETLAAVNAGTAQAVAATNQTFHDTVNALSDKYSELARDIGGLAVGQANLLAKENECCCQTLRAIDGVNYANAINTAAINENTTAQTQKILDAITGNRMADMQSQINQLQLQQAVAGVVRYPSASTYYAGTNPFCACGGATL
jgi:hypothetical protein